MKRRFMNLAKALQRNELLVAHAVLAYEHTRQGDESVMHKLVCLRADELASEKRRLEQIANKERSMQNSKFSQCFRPVMENLQKHEKEQRAVQKSRVGPVSGSDPSLFE